MSKNWMTVTVTEIRCDNCGAWWAPKDGTDWSCPTVIDGEECGANCHCGAAELRDCPSCHREVRGIRRGWLWRPLCDCLSGRKPIRAVSELEYRFITEAVHPEAKALCESDERPPLDSVYRDLDWATLTRYQRLYVLGYTSRGASQREWDEWHEKTLLADRKCPRDYWWPRCQAMVRAVAEEKDISFSHLWKESQAWLEGGWRPLDIFTALRAATSVLHRANEGSKHGGKPVNSPHGLLMNAFKARLMEMAGRTPAATSVDDVPPPPNRKPSNLKLAGRSRSFICTKPDSDFDELPLEKGA